MPGMPDALVERDGSTLVVTMNRPHRKNAQSGAMLCRMYDAWVEASTNDDIRCIIITGAEGNFSSGADLRATRPAPPPKKGMPAAAASPPTGRRVPRTAAILPKLGKDGVLGLVDRVDGWEHVEAL